jgi:hypothetical protein
MFTPRIEPAFQDPHLVDAYPLQSHRRSRADEITPRRAIEDDLDVIRNRDVWRLSKARGI